MAFGQQKVHGRRGRPPKDPNARANAARVSVTSDDIIDDLAGPSRPSPTAGTAALTSGFAPVKLRKTSSGETEPIYVMDANHGYFSDEDFWQKLQDLRSQYENHNNERVLQAVRERDAIQAQFDRLKELRVTQSEKTLVEWKKASETRHRHTLESLAAWKNRAEHAEHRLREFEREGEAYRPAKPESESKLAQLEQEVASLTDKLAEAKQALEDEALRRAQLETQLQASAREKTVREDEMAIRRMYEDLTGFTVTEVTMHDASQSSRRFEVSFTGTDYFDLQFALEESRLSASQDARATAAPRDDFIYIPHVDETRDAGLLASENMPDHFLDQIRFERSAAIKFLTALHRSLRT
ncbi:hypothetical protein MNAN1_002165 [Malassezia nana]|uniref:Monopolin complex subunit Csm1/Pcs1 C-terminal domain-containing protein n=1 Tax=Malassezia nana TaxID=180528 RepID=A0AAF0EK17_9BASI|nr:hypothetical protein MNAN1_002165 [Malassezia nana]